MDQATRRRLERQRDYYEARAADFDHQHLGSRCNRNHLAKIRRIRHHLALAPGQRVLEVGTGTGIHATWLLEACPVDYVGVDLSPAMLEVARQRLGDGVELAEAPAEELPFDEESFDAVFCSGTLHHVADRARAVAEMRRVARRGARLVISEPNPWNPLNALAWATDRAERGQLDMRPALLRKWLEHAGCAVDHVEFFNFTPPSPSSLSRQLDAVDALLAKLPGVRRIASMVLVAATAS